MTLLVIFSLEPDVEFQLPKAVSMSVICPEVNSPVVGDKIYMVTDAPLCQPAAPCQTQPGHVYWASGQVLSSRNNTRRAALSHCHAYGEAHEKQRGNDESHLVLLLNSELSVQRCDQLLHAHAD